MVGKGSQSVLALRSPDPVLAAVGSIGLAAAAGTALVLDLASPEMVPNRRTLRDLVVDGPSLTELSPTRSGVALIRGGGVDLGAAFGLIDRMRAHWPAIVVRVVDGTCPFPVVPVYPLYPGRLLPVDAPGHCVWQPVGTGATPPGQGLVLPRLRPGALRQILSLHLPRRCRWIAAWSRVWEMPWA